MVLMGKAGKKPTSRDDASHAHLNCTCSSSPHLMAIMCAAFACAEHLRDAPTGTEPSHTRLHCARCSSPCLMALMSIAFACLEHSPYVPTRYDASHVRLDGECSGLGSVCAPPIGGPSSSHAVADCADTSPRSSPGSGLQSLS